MAVLKLAINTSNLDIDAVETMIRDLNALRRAKEQEVISHRPILLPLNILQESIIHNADGEMAATWEVV